jgi:hypothetical protein
MQDELVKDLKEVVREAKEAPDGQGNFVALYGAYCLSSSRLRPHSALCRAGHVERDRPADGRNTCEYVLGLPVSGVGYILRHIGSAYANWIGSEGRFVDVQGHECWPWVPLSPTEELYACKVCFTIGRS